ncbi:methionyl-tRNA formyltransferase [Fulvimarina sp. 2208YS6-2-32]|uniref:Methionyl-tRNA formyltransferase n=1 Tax=Fulvimarina uroteuthidis TaxID=3098149 RepID=A0ABU5I382_9HYPH|nr:methionyl-tRNA formyltransferase [Fulvimarina sp. 2208YS6-2-32]MDY8109238.1 methionyl-tRNA formyltransferase [Fulvimarina sp. 2208YS6-2-32]
MSLKLAFMGTPAFAVPTLRAIHRAGHRIACVYSQPPRKAGRRGLTLTPSPVHQAAESLGLPVQTPLNFRDEADRWAFAAHNLDVAVVVAYGLLLPDEILEAPTYGCLNGHGSLLPRWRGAAPIQRAIQAGDTETGMMVMRMETGLDTGPVARTIETAIGETETAGELHDRMAALCADLMVDALSKLQAGVLHFEDQDAIARRTGRDPCYARKIDKGEARIDFTRRAGDVARQINAFSPFPGAWTMLPVGDRAERVKVLRARAEDAHGEPGTALDGELLIACGSGSVRLLELQRAGGKPMAAADLLRGVAVPAGTVLGHD